MPALATVPANVVVWEFARPGDLRLASLAYWPTAADHVVAVSLPDEETPYRHRCDTVEEARQAWSSEQKRLEAAGWRRI